MCVGILEIVHLIAIQHRRQPFCGFHSG
jgi:hypothetical protein